MDRRFPRARRRRPWRSSGAATRSTASLRAPLEKALPGDSVALLVLHGGRRAFIPLRVP